MKREATNLSGTDDIEPSPLEPQRFPQESEAFLATQESQDCLQAEAVQQTTQPDQSKDEAQDAGNTAQATQSQPPQRHEIEEKGFDLDGDDELSDSDEGGKSHDKGGINLFDEEGEDEDKGFLEQIVTCSYWEMTFAFLIVMNTLSMCAEAEYRGSETGYSILDDCIRLAVSTPSLNCKTIQ